MRKRLAVIGIVLLGACAVFLVAAKIVHLAWNGERAGRSISAWSSRWLSGRGGPERQAMRFGRVDWPFWPALRSLLGGRPVRVEVSDFGLWDPDGSEVIAARRVRTGLALDALVWHRLAGALPGARGNLQLRLSDTIVEGPRCSIEPSSSGRVNLVAAFVRRPDAPPPDPRAGMVLSVDGSTLLDARFLMRLPRWEARLERMTVRLRELRFSSFREEQAPHRPAFTYVVEKIEAPAGQVEIDELRFPLDDIALTELRAVDADRQDLHLAGTAHSRGARLRFKGALLDVYSQARGADVELVGEQGRRVLASLPWRNVLSGDAGARLHVSGRFSDVTLEGSVHGLDVTLFGVEARQGSTHYKVHDKIVHLAKLHASVAGGVVEGRATLRPAERAYRVELEPHDLQPSQLGKLLPLEILATLSGLVASKDPGRAGEAAGGAAELVNHVRLKGVDIAMFRPTRTSPPRRIVVTKPAGP